MLYLLLALSAPFGLLYVPGKLVQPGNATATADNIRASASLLRFGIASELIHQVIAVFLVLALYRLLKPVSEALSKQMVVFGALLSVPIVFVNVLNNVAALVLVSGADFLSVFEKRQLDALAYVFVRLHEDGITVASIFWGLWLLPFGTLVIRSGYIPRLLGVLLLVAGISYLVNSFVALVLPEFSRSVSQVAGPLQFGELPIIVWLLVWGARVPSDAARSTSKTSTQGRADASSMR
jgi:hypothetical protein